jgi:hypothetical protein
MQLLVPLVMAVSIVTFLLILGIGLWPTEDELRAQIALETRLKDEGQGADRANGFRGDEQPRVTRLTRTPQTY